MLENKIEFPPHSYYLPFTLISLDVLKEDLIEFNKYCGMVRECILFSDEMEKYSDFFMVFYI